MLQGQGLPQVVSETAGLETSGDGGLAVGQSPPGAGKLSLKGSLGGDKSFDLETSGLGLSVDQSWDHGELIPAARKDGSGGEDRGLGGLAEGSSVLAQDSSDGDNSQDGVGAWQLDPNVFGGENREPAKAPQNQQLESVGDVGDLEDRNSPEAAEMAQTWVQPEIRSPGSPAAAAASAAAAALVGVTNNGGKN